MHSNPRIWFVDDLQSNLDEFVEAHRDSFEITTFTDPNAVLERLQNERPDALLCDVFFYDTPEDAKTIEDRITGEAEALAKVAKKIGATDDKYLAGITLMEEIHRKFNGSLPFPVYAYTSKGPYLLAQAAWGRILGVGVNVLLKKRYGRTVERTVIQRDIDQFREENSWRVKAAKHLHTVLITWGLFTTTLGILIGRFLLP
jgi:CheY-like chemotaxis protein